jgi:molybdopterin molybdotransferase
MATRLAANELRSLDVAGKLSNADSRSIGTLMPVTQAVALLTALIKPAPAFVLGIRDAANFVLAEPIIAPTAVPPVSIALSEGYAVAASDTVGASSYTPVLLHTPPSMIAAGSALPEGTDAMVPPDALSVEAGFAQITQAVTPGENVRRPGEDARQGAILRAAGELVRPIDVASGIAAGIEECSIRRLDAGLLLASQPDEAACTLVTAFLRKSGASISTPLSFTNQASLSRALGESGADLIIVIGGTGFGLPGHAPSAVAEAGTLITHGLALRPGEAGGCGLVNEKPVLLVPHRLEAALAMMLMIAQPCLDLLFGTAPARAMRRGILTRKLASTVGLSEIALLRDVDAGLEPLAIADLSLSAISSADAWLAVPPGGEGVAAGTIVEAHAL